MKKIQIRDITPGGLHIEDTISRHLFETSPEDYIKIIEPVRVKAVLRRFESTVLGDIVITTRFDTFCCRSLEKIQRDWSIRFTLDYEIEPHQEYLEIEEDIRQEILLQLPLRILSDAEMAKEAKELEAQNIAQKDLPPDNTYKPFEGMKDLE